MMAIPPLYCYVADICPAIYLQLIDSCSRDVNFQIYGQVHFRSPRRPRTAWSCAILVRYNPCHLFHMLSAEIRSPREWASEEAVEVRQSPPPGPQPEAR